MTNSCLLQQSPNRHDQLLSSNLTTNSNPMGKNTDLDKPKYFSSEKPNWPNGRAEI